MRAFALLLSASFLAACATSAPERPSAAAGSVPTLAFTHVSVVPMDSERVLEDQTVLVQGDRIVAVGPARSTRAPADATVVDGKGRFLMPGLVDMHLHLPPGEGTPQDPAGQVLALLNATGVTTARALVAAPTALRVRDAVARGERVGPRLLVAAPSLHGFPNPKAKPVQGPDDARARVRDAKAQGYDVLKTHGALPRETYDALVAEAKAQGLELVGHVTPEVGIHHALASGQDVEHLDGYLQALLPAGDPGRQNPSQVVVDDAILRADEEGIPALVQETVRAGVANSPTLALFEIIAGPEGSAVQAARPEMRYAPRAALAQWAQRVDEDLKDVPAEHKARYLALRRKVARALYDGGATMVVGSDSPQLFMVAGFALHRELQAHQAAGVKPYQVLRAATVNAARVLGDADSGTVAVGKRADLVLLDANPLADVKNAEAVRGVVQRGRWLSREALDAPLEAIAAQMAAPAAP